MASSRAIAVGATAAIAAVKAASMILRRTSVSASNKEELCAETVLTEYRTQWLKDLFQRVVPFWLKNSPDTECGGYFTALDADGTVYDTTKYLWLQGRAVYMFALLASNKYKSVVDAQCRDTGADSKNVREQWVQAARIGAESLDKAFGSAPGTSSPRLFFSATRDWQLKHYQRKPYAAVFYTMGCLQYAVLLRERGGAADEAKKYFEKAESMFVRCRDWFRDPSLCGRPKQPAPADGKESGSALADVMCLACMAIEFLEHATDAAEKSRYRAIIRKAMDSSSRHFHPKLGVYLENAGPRGVDMSKPSGRFFVPGHSIEVGWFLLYAAEALGGDRKIEDQALTAIVRSMELGWDEKYGGLLYMMDVLGERPLLDATVTANNKLWWPHTEALIALTSALRTLQSRGTNVESPQGVTPSTLLLWLVKTEAFCQRAFVDKQHGGWFGYCRRDGGLHSTAKGGNYKGFFHTPRGLLFSAIAAGKYLEAVRK